LGASGLAVVEKSGILVTSKTQKHTTEMKKPFYLPLLLLLAVLAVPHGSYAQDDEDFEGTNISYQIDTDGGGTKIRIREINQSFDLNYDGEIRFNEDFTDFDYISPGGYVVIKKTSFGNKRRLELKGKSGGEIKREFWDGGREKPYEPDGRKFLEEILPDVLRSTRIGAPDRVARLYEKNGARGVVEEIEDIDSDYIKAYYLDLAFQLEGISTRDEVAFLEVAGEEVDSDYELSKLLQAVGPDMLEKDLTEDAFLGAVAEIDSDFETARILRELVKDYDLTDERMVAILEDMDSDFEKTRILREAVEKRDITRAELITVLDLLDHVDSDFEKVRVMRTVVQKKIQGLEGTKLILDRLDDIDSDFERSRILNELIGMYDLEEDAMDLTLDALSTIDSDFEKARILQNLLKDENFSDAAYLEMLDRIDEIDSDFERSRLFEMVLSNELDAKALDKVIDAIDNVDSEFEQAKLLRAAARRDDLKTADYLAILDAASELGDWEHKNVMIEVLKVAGDNAEVKKAIRQNAKALSDHEYGQVMRMLEN